MRTRPSRTRPTDGCYAASAFPMTVSMMWSRNAGSLPDERAHAIKTTAIATKARKSPEPSDIAAERLAEDGLIRSVRALVRDGGLQRTFLVDAIDPDTFEQIRAGVDRIKRSMRRNDWRRYLCVPGPGAADSERKTGIERAP